MDAFRYLTLPSSYDSGADKTLIFHEAKAGSTALLSMIALAHGLNPDGIAANLLHPELAWYHPMWSAARHLSLAAANPEDRLEICIDPGVERIALV